MVSNRRNEAGRKANGGKAIKKRPNALSSKCKSGKAKAYGPRNSVGPMPTPSFRKGIEEFLDKDQPGPSKAHESDESDEMPGDPTAPDAGDESLMDDLDEDSPIPDSQAEEESPIPDGQAEEESAIGDGREEESAIGDGREEESAIGDGREEESAIGDGREEESAIGDGREEESAIGDGREEESAIGDGREEESAIGDCDDLPMNEVSQKRAEVVHEVITISDDEEGNGVKPVSDIIIISD